MSFQSWQLIVCTHAVIPQVVAVVSRVTQLSIASANKRHRRQFSAAPDVSL